MRSAQNLLEELVTHVQPPSGCAIVLTELRQDSPAARNWTAAAGMLDGDRTRRYQQKLSELLRSDPQIDWGDVPILVADRRKIAHWIHQVE